MKRSILALLLVTLVSCAKVTPPETPSAPARPSEPGAAQAPAPAQARAASGSQEKTDDWEYVPQEAADGAHTTGAMPPARYGGNVTGGAQGGVVGGVVGGLPGAPPPPPPPSPVMASRALGLSAGGAKDVGSFRENIKAGYLPLPTDISYEGLFYDYSFDTGAAGKCERLFCPSYVAAVSPDPFSHKNEVFLSVGLNSGLDASQFSRKRLNLVVVLDISGSMSAPFNKHYYDGRLPAAEADPADAPRTKLEVATRSIVGLLSHLRDDDRLGIVLFDQAAYRAKRLRALGLSDREKLNAHLLALQPASNTNMEAGLRMAVEMLEPFREADREEYENRIIFLTDAMPNTGRTGEQDLLQITRTAAGNGIYATFIGIGVDFNTELVSSISKIRGANYYSVHSAREFRKRLDEEFEFMVTPLVFDLELRLETSGWEIVEVYGSPEASEATGEIMKVNTLFPSKVEGGETRGGVVLLKLRRQGGAGRLALTASYEDRAGRRESETKEVALPSGKAPHYPNTGIRKAILLARYADLLRHWALDEGASRVEKRPVVVSIDEAEGITCPRIPDLGRWERQSLPLQVSAGYRALMARFQAHFQTEATALDDAGLDREAGVLEYLAHR